MRRLAILILTAAAVCLCGCRRERIPFVPTEENSIRLEPEIQAGDPADALQLVRGFHQTEFNAWRWTMGHFAVLLRIPDGAKTNGARLVLDFSAPEQLIRKRGPVTVTVSHSGIERARHTISAAGAQTAEFRFSSGTLQGETAAFDFRLDRYFQAGEEDRRELGIIVTGLRLLSP